MSVQRALYQFNDARLPLIDDDYVYFSQDDQNPKNRKAKLSDYKAYFSLQADTEIEIPTGLTLTQIQALIDSVPKILNSHSLTFTFKIGTHNIDGTILISGFTGGILTIRGEASTIIETSVNNAPLFYILSCSSLTTLEKLDIRSSIAFTSTQSILSFQNINSITISEIIIIDSDFANYGRVSFFGCQGRVKSCDINYMDRGIEGVLGSVVVIETNNTFGGTGSNTNDLASSSSVVIYQGNIAGITYVKASGGQIADQTTGWL